MGPYIVGHTYRVTCVRGRWNNIGPIWWPVNGKIHDDADFLDFPWNHWHIDHRFVTAAKWRDDHGSGGPSMEFYRSPIHALSVEPLGVESLRKKIPEEVPWTGRGVEIQRSRLAKTYLESLPRKSWFQLRRKKCLRQYSSIPELSGLRNKLRPGYENARLDLKRRICPHKGTDLRTIPVRDGVIECPLHGLQFCAETGETLWL